MPQEQGAGTGKEHGTGNGGWLLLDTGKERILEYARTLGKHCIPEEGSFLPEVYITSSDNFDQSLKRFNKLVQQSGILAEARRRGHYEPPSVHRKKKAAAKRRKSLKNATRG